MLKMRDINADILSVNFTIYLLYYRTPTPFKLAMAELGKKSGLRYEPSSPGLLVEDITEMIQREESDSTVQLNDSLLSGNAEQEGANIQVSNGKVYIVA